MILKKICVSIKRSGEKIGGGGVGKVAIFENSFFENNKKGLITLVFEF